MLEKELRARELKDKYPASKHRKRHLKELKAQEVTDIVHAYLVEHVPQEEIAHVHRVSAPLVSRLVCEARKTPEKQSKRRQKEKNREEQGGKISQAAAALINERKPIHNVCQIKQKVQEEHSIVVQ